jgi:hypothetical protein
MCFDERAADRDAHSHAGSPSRKERLQELLHCSGVGLVPLGTFPSDWNRFNGCHYAVTAQASNNRIFQNVFHGQ